MSKPKKGLDRKKVRKRAVVSTGRLREKSKKRTGRPPINQNRLLGDRDAILQLLSSKWERIGWRLERAHSPEMLRKAFRPLDKEQSSKHLIQYFLRPTVENATAGQIRHTLKLLGEELEENDALRSQCNTLMQKYDQADSAGASAAPENKMLLNREFDKRATDFEKCERNLVASDYRLGDFENKLADQRAFLSQNELLRFKARQYAHNPKTYANAMAGLPEIGARQSFRLCSKITSPLWPSYHFEIFRFIEKTWNNRVMDPAASLEAQFREAVLRLPVMVEIEKAEIEKYKLESKTRENYFRKFFCENWRYLRLAINEVVRHQRCIHSSAVPYLITTWLFINYGKPRTAQDTVVVEIEALKD